jgi:ATP-dependent exoDNAse (exonuclease V) beta subunit
LAAFVLQSVKDNKQRHEQLQRFMLANDSVTVATEVPIYIRKEDIEHMENDLGFQILEHNGDKNSKFENQNPKQTGKKSQIQKTETETGYLTIKGNKVIGLPRLLTGHIDLVQIRNGQIHLLDYKPNAAKEKPVEQLTWYALAMARLTGLRMYDFTCSWFDEKDFFQFYPLHVVKKLKSKVRKKRKVYFKDGTWGEVPRKNELVVVQNNGPGYDSS